MSGSVLNGTGIGELNIVLSTLQVGHVIPPAVIVAVIALNDTVVITARLQQGNNMCSLVAGVL